MIYTTNAVEALHRSLRKIIKTRGSFPNDDAALKLLYLAIKNAGLRWRRGKASISRLIRRTEFGRSASSVKAGLRPPPAAAAALTELAARPLLATMGSMTMSG